MMDQGFPGGEGGDAPTTQGGSIYLLFGAFLAENYLKMKQVELRRGARVTRPLYPSLQLCSLDF